MLNTISNKYFSIYSGGVAALGLVTLSCHLLNKNNNAKIQKCLQHSKLWQNLLFAMPTAWTAYKSWKYLAGGDPQASRVLKLCAGVAFAVPTAYMTSAIYVLGGPEQNHSLDVIPHLFKPVFPVLHVAVLSFAIVKGKISRLEGVAAMAVCLALLAVTAKQLKASSKE